MPTRRTAPRSRRRPRIVRAPIAIAIVCAACGGSSQGQRAPATCPSPRNVLAGVYHPSRLHVLAPCRTIFGVVTAISHEQDGDLHVAVNTHGALTNALNRSKLGGDLLVEFMPRDGGHLPAPRVGSRIRLTGAWVLDTNHGWDELHPVWSETLAGVTYRSGPHYGGSPRGVGSSEASAQCTTNLGAPCRGYGPRPARVGSRRAGSSRALTPLAGVSARM